VACGPEPEAVVGDSVAVAVPVPQPLLGEVFGAADFVVELGPGDAWMVLSLWTNSA
jgi:hypothetical protein